MAIAFIIGSWSGQSTIGESSHATNSVDTTGGNFVVAVITSNNAVQSVTDNKSNGYTLIGPFAGAGADNVYIAYTNNSTAATCGTGHVITANSAGSSFITISAAAYSGLATSGVLDKQHSASGTGTALDSGSTTTTAQANELLIGGGTVAAGSTVTWTAGTGYTIRSSVTNAAVGGVSYLEEKIVSATGTYNATATSSVSGGWDAAIATFKDAAAGGATTKVLSDTTTISDGTIQYLRRVRVQNDLLTIADAIVNSIIGGGSVTTKVMTDTTILTDQVVEWLRRKRDLIETLTITDDPTRTIQLILDDLSIEVNDELRRALARGRVATDTISPTDSLVQWRRIARLTQDGLTLVDSINRSVSGGGTLYTKVLTETLDITDGFIEWRRLRRLLEDNAALLDGFTKIIAGAGITYVKVLSDALTLIDDNGQRWTMRKSQLTDAVGLSDELKRALARIAILGENIEVSDGTVRILRAVRVGSDTITATDEMVRAYYADQLFTVVIVFRTTDPLRFGSIDPLRMGGR